MYQNSIFEFRKCYNGFSKTRRGYAKLIDLYFDKHPELSNIKKYIPNKYLSISSKVANEHLYLICVKTAKIIADHVIPFVKEDQIVAESNVGLGLITTELLEKGVKRVRMYETCPEFRVDLKSFDSAFPGRVELFTKNLFHLGRFSFLDKQDGINRVDILLKGVPKKAWTDDPSMTVVGTMPNLNFLKYLIKSLALQTGPSVHGRMQIFGIIREFDYKNEDMVLVRMNFKKELPVSMDKILYLFFFLKQFYGTGNNRIIPTVEKWVPNSGLNVILPKLKHQEYYKDINIFTRFRDLTPPQILAVFKEVINIPSFESSPFTAMVENELIKSETVETSLADVALEKQITGDIGKLNLQDEFD
uniref:Dimethyladenosine transferase 2, mitochondrial n=1 Tax=Diabrotica virgifera virgifera TaxID=50390 RepID=A0A6P7G9E1_DIAVI